MEKGCKSEKGRQGFNFLSISVVLFRIGETATSAVSFAVFVSRYVVSDVVDRIQEVKNVLLHPYTEKEREPRTSRSLWSLTTR